MITKSPNYVDETSLLNKKQILKLNSIIKSQLNLFTSKAIQKQLEDKVVNPVTASSSAITQLEANAYKDYIFIKMYVNPRRNMDLVEINEDIVNYTWEGYFDTTLSQNLKDFGTITYKNHTFSLECSNTTASRLYINIRCTRKTE